MGLNRKEVKLLKAINQAVHGRLHPISIGLAKDSLSEIGDASHEFDVNPNLSPANRQIGDACNLKS